MTTTRGKILALIRNFVPEPSASELKALIEQLVAEQLTEHEHPKSEAPAEAS